MSAYVGSSNNLKDLKAATGPQFVELLAVERRERKRERERESERERERKIELGRESKSVCVCV